MLSRAIDRPLPGIRGTPFRLLLASTVLGFAGYSLLLPVVPLWVVQGGSGAFGAGASTGVFMLVTVLTQLGVPWLLRRVGHRWVLVAGLVLLGGSAPGLAMSAELAPVLALCAVRGVGFGLLTVAGSALVAELTPTSEHGRASALLGLAIGLPQLVLLPVGVGLVDRFGFGPVFWASAVPVLGVLFVPGIRSDASTRVDPHRPAPVPVATPNLGRWIAVGPVLAMLVCSIAQGGLITFLPLVAGGALVVAPLALFGTAVGALIGRLVAGQLTDRRGLGGRLLGPGVLVTLVGMLGEVLATGLPGVPAAALLVGGALLVGVGFGLVQNDSLVAMFAAAGPARYGSASALWNIAYDAGTGAGAVGLGAVAEPFGFRAAFGVAAVLLALAAPVCFWPRRSGRSGSLDAV